MPRLAMDIERRRSPLFTHQESTGNLLFSLVITKREPTKPYREPTKALMD